eukprot:CAMPEP_0114601098 /NCGR_PEP_ID=MMETSP0125-20121206/23740_1 /TAXON_ID=485358 ORGANISM="Aristerostoma sp., Strain ATCC 50986" /NCGR_SAMPLE_ID=MMETSP0125 /ASSEMBLY_ACC=CAM_ASM_000245 /LENGTH=55 /DNA_ID=CAMNT_0001810033 /DNA_START=98 /DNA_END=262 /DNA_ORIENTATION=-
MREKELEEEKEDKMNLLKRLEEERVKFAQYRPLIERYDKLRKQEKEILLVKKSEL